MKAKDLAQLLLQHPEKEVTFEGEVEFRTESVDVARVTEEEFVLFVEE